MNLVLDQFAENPIIDELVVWPPRTQKMNSIRGCSSLFRRPFIEIEFEDGEFMRRHFSRDSFAQYWAEAVVILQTLTDVKMISEFSHGPYQNTENLLNDLLTVREESIAESNLMFANGMFEQFLNQYGEDYKDLPADAMEKISLAKIALDKKP
jgi:hypothetical protein